MGCATTTVKISTIIFNVVLATLGIGAVVWVALNSDSLSTEIEIAYYVTGALIILFAILGCVAAIRESVCLAAVCAIFLLILVVLQTATICFNQFSEVIPNGLDVVTEAWNKDKINTLQQIHECCGKDSAQDYVLLSKPIPVSCFADQDYTVPSKLFLDGCNGKIRDFYDNRNLRLIIVSCLLIAFEFIGFLLAVFLVINFRNKQRRMKF